MNLATQAQQPTLVFIHGFLDGATAWDDVIAALGDSAAATLAVTLPGLGARAGDAAPASLDELADDVRRQMQSVRGPVVLVGHSMGAQVAELVAVTMPDAVRALVLMTPVPLKGMGLDGDAMKTFHALGGNPAAQRQLRQSLSVNLDARRLEGLCRLGDGVEPTAVGPIAELWNRGHLAGGLDSAYRGQVVIVRGAGDGFITAQTVAEQVQGRFEHARVDVVGGAGHWPHVEQPQAVARILEPLAAAEAVTPQGWTRAFAQKSAQAFSDAVAPDMVLEASFLTRPLVGTEAVKTLMGVASGIYELVTFTHQAHEGSRDYLEWEAAAFGGEKLYGITILTKNAQGKVQRAAIHHRPGGMLLKFAGELSRRLQGQIHADYFVGV